MNEDQSVMFAIVNEKLRFHFNFARRLMKFVPNLSISPSMHEHCSFCNHNDSNSKPRIYKSLQLISQEWASVLSHRPISVVWFVSVFIHFLIRQLLRAIELIGYKRNKISPLNKKPKLFKVFGNFTSNFTTDARKVVWDSSVAYHRKDYPLCRSRKFGVVHGARKQNHTLQLSTFKTSNW